MYSRDLHQTILVLVQYSHLVYLQILSPRFTLATVNYLVLVVQQNLSHSTQTRKKHSSTLLVLDPSDLQDLTLAMVLYSQSMVLQNLLLSYHQQKDYSNSAVLLQKEHPQSRRAVVFYSTSLPASSVVHLHTARQAHLIFLVSLTLQEQLITLDLVICLQLMVLLSLQQIELLLKVTLHSVAMLRLSLLEDSLDLEIYSDSTVQLSLEQSLFLREQSTTLLVLLARDSQELLHLISILRSLVPQLKDSAEVHGSLLVRSRRLEILNTALLVSYLHSELQGYSTKMLFLYSPEITSLLMGTSMLMFSQHIRELSNTSVIQTSKSIFLLSMLLHSNSTQVAPTQLYLVNRESSLSR